MKKIFVDGIAVIEGTEAHKAAIAFKELLGDHGMKTVCYRTGVPGHGWSYDVYVVPYSYKKPYFQKKCTGEHIISMNWGYHVSSLDNKIMADMARYTERLKTADIISEAILLTMFNEEVK